MSETAKKSRLAYDFLALALCGLSSVVFVWILLWIKADSQVGAVSGAGFSESLIDTGIDWLGLVPLAALSLALAALAVLAFTRTQRLNLGRHLAGLSGTAIGLSIMLGVLGPQAGGRLGQALPGLLGGIGGRVAALALGLATGSAAFWIAWRESLPARRVEAEPPAPGADLLRQKRLDEGVTAAEAVALTPRSTPTGAASSPGSPRPSQDVRLAGGVPQGARPLDPLDVGLPSRSVPRVEGAAESHAAPALAHTQSVGTDPTRLDALPGREEFKARTHGSAESGASGVQQPGSEARPALPGMPRPAPDRTVPSWEGRASAEGLSHPSEILDDARQEPDGGGVRGGTGHQRFQPIWEQTLHFEPADALDLPADRSQAEWEALQEPEHGPGFDWPYGEQRASPEAAPSELSSSASAPGSLETDLDLPIGERVQSAPWENPEVIGEPAEETQTAGPNLLEPHAYDVVEIEGNPASLAPAPGAAPLHVLQATLFELDEDLSPDPVPVVQSDAPAEPITQDVAAASLEVLAEDEKLLGQGPRRVRARHPVPRVDAEASAEPEPSLSDYELSPQPPTESRARQSLSTREKLILEAGLLFLERQRVAVSMLQRHFGLDFKQATELLDELQARGLIGPYMGGTRRDILLSREQWVASVEG